jgi:hypothetical protein
MALAYSTTLRNAQLDAIDDAMNAGSAGATLKIYSGTRPSTGAALGGGNTLLATLTFSTTAFGAASGGSITAASITSDSTADATGTASFFRIEDSDSTFIMDGDCGTSGSDLNLDTTSISAGATVSISSFVITAGNS